MQICPSALQVCYFSGGDEDDPSPIRVAVQASAGRHVSTVASTACLQDVIRAAMPACTDLQLSGASVVYMRRALPQEAMQRTLADIGISSGSAVFRVTFPEPAPAQQGGNEPAAAAASNTAEPPLATTQPQTAAADTSTEPTGGDDGLGAAPPPPLVAVPQNQAQAHSTNETAQALCAAVRQAMFDVDAAAALGLVLKLLDNVLRKPGQPAVRSVRLGNPRVLAVLGRHAPPLALLLAAGFAADQGGTVLGVPTATGGSTANALLQAAVKAQQAPAHCTLVLDTAHENTEQLLAVRRAVARELGEGLHKPPPAEPDTTAAAAAAAAVPEFDIFKGMVMSTASRPGRPQPHEMVAAAQGGARSKCDRELQALREAEAEIRRGFPHSAAHPPPRNTTVMLPSALPGYNPGKFMDAPVSAGVSVYTPPPASAAGGGAAAAASSTPSDSAVVMGMLRARVEESEKSQRFRSQAERDVEAARRKRVYPDALLRVQFPDRVLLQGRFACDETVQSVVDWLVSCLAQSWAQRGSAALKLYVSPPRKDLPAAATLESLSLAPAALVYASWVDPVPVSGSGEAGEYLQPQLRQAGAAFAKAHLSNMQGQLKQEQASTKSAMAASSEKTAEMRQARLEAMAKRLLGGKK